MSDASTSQPTGGSTPTSPVSPLEGRLILLGVTLVTGLVSIYFFRWSEHRAREKGLIDMTTHY